ncbi:MAG TPA: Precorrin-3B methylase [Chthoniobacter sp.]|nr:Precorrin-3B methylase [Chthoniobacter sp.]
MSLELFSSFAVPAKKHNDQPLTGEALIKETCRRIRVARSYWDAHNNAACRGEREKALQLYESLSKAEREKIPQVLRVWLRYRSEKYFGEGRTPPGGKRR